ncbi:MAG: metal ABC transporter permease [Candidatus Dojkabacteria bacterium]
MIVEWLLEPLRFQFVQYGLLEMVILSVLTAVVGSLIVVRNLAFVTEAIAHGVFPGIVVAILLQFNFLIGAIVSALLTVMGISVTSSNRKVSENTAIGILFSTALAIGVVLISTTRNFKTSLSDVLIGDVLGVGVFDIITSVSVLAGVLIFVIVWYRHIVLTSFDPQFAKAIGINVKLINFVLYLSIAATVVVSVQAVGNLLIVAMATIPAASARLTSRRIPEIMLKAIQYSLVISVLGMYLTFYLNLATGATIVLLQSLWFYLVYGYTSLLKK